MRTMNKIIMTLAGLLLIAAAVLKFQEMLSTCVPSWQDNPTGFWESYEFFLIQIPLEFALGVWLVSGLFRKAASIAGSLAFFGFICVTIFKIITGAESCGCFGQIQVDPKITLFIMDIPVFLLLAIFWPRSCKLLPPPWPNLAYLLAVFVPTIGLMVITAPAMVTLRPDCIKVEDAQPDVGAKLKLELYKVKQELSAKQRELEKQKQETERLQQELLGQKQAAPQTEPEIVDPEIEIQQPIANPDEQPTAVEQWDWLEFVVEDDTRQQISEGLVVVMMHRYDCEVCEEMAPQYSEYYRQLVDQGADEFKIAFLAIPPYGDEDHVPDDTTCIVGNLTEEKKWGLMSPFVVALLDSQLVKQWEQGTAPEPENLLEEIFGQ